MLEFVEVVFAGKVIVAYLNALVLVAVAQAVATEVEVLELAGMIALAIVTFQRCCRCCCLFEMMCLA